MLCGYSDITALQNATLARTGLITYTGPHWSTFGKRDHFEQTLAWFRHAILGSDPYEIEPASFWTDDLWFPEARRPHPRADHRMVAATARHRQRPAGRRQLCTFNLLQGGPYRPSLPGAVVLVEDDELTNPVQFARDLTSLLQLPDASQMTALIIGRFQRASAVDRPILQQIIERQPVLAGLPVLATSTSGLAGRTRGHSGFGRHSPRTLTRRCGGTRPPHRRSGLSPGCPARERHSSRRTR